MSGGEIVDERLATLAYRIEVEHRAVAAAGSAMIGHAISCGEALIEARDRVPHGEWEAWLLREFPGRSLKTWRLYMRVARHKARVLEVGPANLQDAHRLLTGAPVIPHEAELRERAIELRAAEGLSYRELAERLGVSQHAVNVWCNPGYAERERERHRQQTQAAQREARQSERDRTMSGDGPVEDAYRKVRAAIRSLNDALEMGLEHPGIRLGITKLQQAEDEITRAVRNGPGTSPTHS